MPVLPLEPFLFPDSLFASAEVDADRPWWVLHTRPRVEKTLARHLLAQGNSFFLPLHEHRLPSRNRVRHSYLPLFPGYVFLQGDDAARHKALETNLVTTCLAVPQQREFFEDLQRVHHLMRTELALTPEERLLPGTPVRVIAGSFAGMTGLVIRRGGTLRFVVEVRFLHQSISVDVEHWMIEPC